MMTSCAVCLQLGRLGARVANGMSVVRLEKVEGNILHIVDVDMIDGTPLLDLKPYVPAFDEYVDVRVGWLQDNLKNTGGKRADRRFDR